MIQIKSYGSSSKGNSYVIADGESSLMLEAGINPDRMTGVNWNNIQGCLISHEHGDHSDYAKKLTGMTPFDVFLTADTNEKLKLTSYRSKIITPLKEFKIGKWSIIPFPVQHDVPTVGFFIKAKDGERILFATDTYYIYSQFPKVTHLMVECNYERSILNQNVLNGSVPEYRSNRIIKSHFELNNLKRFISSNDMSELEEVWLLHLSNQNSDGERFKKEIQSITGKPVYIA